MRRSLTLFFVLAACDQGGAAPPSPPKPPSAPASTPGPAAPAAPAVPGAPGVAGMPTPEQIAQLQQQALQATVGQQQKPAVNWRELMPLLTDELAGWKAKEPAKGETNTAGAVTVSQVERRYEKDGKETTLQIFDTAVMPMLASAFQMARMVSSDGSDHYARSFEIEGHLGWEQWHKGGNAEVTMLVAKRFLVKAEANGLADTKPLTELIAKLGVAKLAELDK